MNDSPRLIQQLRSTAQNPATAGGAGTATTHDACGVCAADSGVSSADHTRTTHATGQKPHTASGTVETSDRLPTEPPRTSDTTRLSTGESTSTLGRRLDERIRLRLAQLEVLPGAISGKGVEQTSASVERALPISWTGHAKGDTSVYVFRKRAAGARSIRAKAAVLKDINLAIDEVKVSRRKGRPEYDLSVKEGRIAAGRLADEHGVAYACKALAVSQRKTMYRYLDEYRRASK